MRAAAQRGSALVPAVALLCSLSLLSMMALMAAGADLVLATRLSRQRAAFYAAESALATTVDELSHAGGAIPEETFFAPWPAPGLPARQWRDGGWACARSLTLLPDVHDGDGDPATTVVLFNRDFGYPESPLEQGGFPVVQVRVSASAGESRQGIVAEVAPITCAPEVAAAWTAAGPLELAGDLEISGASPAIIGRGSVFASGGAAVHGGIAVDPDLALPDDAFRIINAGGTLRGLDDLPAPPAEGPPSGVVWAQGDFGGDLNGSGILVVHNPRFDPVQHEASRRAVEEGVEVEGRDPTYSHLDPTRQPARLELFRGGAFRGLIIADALGSCVAPFSLTGGLVTLSRSPLTVSAPAAVRITYQRSAIVAAGRGPLGHVAAFRPLADLPEVR